MTKAQFEHLVRIGAWTRVHVGVYRNAATPATWESEVVAACLTGGDRTAASHRSAAALHRLPGGARSFVEITCLRWGRSHRAGLVVHETNILDEADLTTVNGLPTTTVERTLLDLGAVCGYLTVQMAFDQALRRGLATWATVEEKLSDLARSGRPGIRKLRAALEARSSTDIPESEQETALLAVLDHHALPTPVPQHVVTDPAGRFVARVSAYPEQRIALEYDSDQEHTSPAALARDNARRNRLIAEGWIVISARREDIRRGGGEFVRAVDTVLTKDRSGAFVADRTGNRSARIG